MKIWYQSASSYRYEKVFDEYGKTIEKQCKRVLRSDTEIYVTGIPMMIRDVENWKHFQYYQKIETLNNMWKAQKEGFDAFVIGCTLDVGLEEGKSMLDIPVVGISETNYHMAMTMGRLFAIVTSSPGLWEPYGDQIDRYGLKSKYLPGPYIVRATEDEIAIALKNPKPLLKRFVDTAKKAVADGASVIIPSPGFLATLAFRTKLTQVEDALVLDTVSVAVKTAEMLVDLRKIGVEPSRRIGVYAKPDKKAHKEAFDKLQKVFKIEYRP